MAVKDMKHRAVHRQIGAEACPRLARPDAEVALRRSQDRQPREHRVAIYAVLGSARLAHHKLHAQGLREVLSLIDATRCPNHFLKTNYVTACLSNHVGNAFEAHSAAQPETEAAVNAQHFSGRTPVDQGRRLWASWVVLGSKRFYFAGDSGYYRHFKEIGDAHWPFDLAALPIGSYTPPAIARPVHTSPEEALQAWLDLCAARFVAIHWGTFALGREPYDEPPRRLAAEIERRNLDPKAIWILKPGEITHW